MGVRAMPEWQFGSWRSASELFRNDGPEATTAQQSAVRYWLRDVPTDVVISSNFAHRILPIRDFLRAILFQLHDEGQARHPWEATECIFAECRKDPTISKSIFLWSNRRWKSDTGPSRIKLTKYGNVLIDKIKRNCYNREPIEILSRQLIYAALVRAGLHDLINCRSVVIRYNNDDDPPERLIRNVVLVAAVPATFLIDPIQSARIHGFCELRGAERTFALSKILSARDVRNTSTNLRA